MSSQAPAPEVKVEVKAESQPAATEDIVMKSEENTTAAATTVNESAPTATAPPVKSEPVAPPASTNGSKPAAASAADQKCPSDSELRPAVKSLLAKSALHTLTPKIVRASLAETFHLTSDSVLDELKARLKTMLPEELALVTGNNSSSAASTSTTVASPVKKEKKRKETASDNDDADGERPKKKAKTASTKKKADGGSSDEPDIDALAAQAEDEDGDEPEEEESQEAKDAALAAALANEGRRPRRAAAPVSKPRKTPVRKPVDPDAPKKMTAISSALSDFFGGVAEMNRGDVVKGLWDYIKKHNLQDPNDKRRILLDDKLKTILGDRKSTDMFKMNKLLQVHLKNKHQLTD